MRTVGHPCAVSLDEIVKGMQGVSWIRFHEYFASLPPLKQAAPKPGHEPKVNGSAMCHNMIETTMRQAALSDMAFAVHGGSELQYKCQLFSEFSIENAEITWNFP